MAYNKRNESLKIELISLFGDQDKVYTVGKYFHQMYINIDDILKTWDGSHQTSDVAPTIFYKTLYKIIYFAMHDELEEDNFRSFLRTQMYKRTYPQLLRKENSKWWDDIQTEKTIESRKTIFWRAFYKAIDKPDKAIQSFENAIAIKPDYAEAHNNLGVTLQELGRLDMAVKNYEKALTIKPDYAEAYNNLGNTLKELRQLDMAVKNYEKALAIKPDYAVAHYNLGIVLMEFGQRDTAVKSFEKALAIQPNYVKAHHSLSILKKFTENDSQITLMQSLLSNSNLSQSERIQLCFALAKANEDLGNQEELFEILKTNIIVVVDETYFEFANVSLAKYTRKFSNLVILRSFSKWAGIAGLRIGYMISNPKIIDNIIKIKQPYNINVAAEAAAINILSNPEIAFEKVNLILKDKLIFESELKKIKGLRLFPSKGNFVLIEFLDIASDEVYNELAFNGIFVRKFSDPKLDKMLRFSIGTTTQMELLLSVMKKILKN